MLREAAARSSGESASRRPTTRRAPLRAWLRATQDPRGRQRRHAVAGSASARPYNAGSSPSPPMNHAHQFYRARRDALLRTMREHPAAASP
jgi:hypothetical protein